MFDTHCHLNFEVYDKNLPQVINSAREGGVSEFLIPGTDLKSSKKAIEITESFEKVFAAVGIHPTVNLDRYEPKEMVRKIEELALSSEKVVAIGETGLDYYKYKSSTMKQKEFFVEQIKLAVKLEKSIIIHSRLAAQDAVSLLDSVWSDGLSESVVFHCCEPDETLLDFAKERKIFIGVDGDVTYDAVKQEFVKKVPLELLVLETDSPFLVPEPLKSRGEKVNLSENLPKIAEAVSQIKNVSYKKLLEIVNYNSKRVFLS